MTCRGCGHGIGYHSDRAVFPPCEGEHPNLHQPMHRYINDEFLHIEVPRLLGIVEPCLCKGFRG